MKNPALADAMVLGGQRERSTGGRLTPKDHFHRACVAAFLAEAGHGHPRFPDAVAKARWPDDEITGLIISRAATTPASTTGWASALAAAAPGEFFASLGATSAASRLITAGSRIPLNGAVSISFPRLATPVTPPWVAEGAPGPVVEMDFSAGRPLGPMRKLMCIVAISGEVAQHTAAEAVVTVLLREAAAAALDVAMFGDTASAAAPLGLLDGLSATAATAGGGSEAMTADLSALIAAAVAGGGNPESMVLIAAAPQAAAIMLQLRCHGRNPGGPGWPGAHGDESAAACVRSTGHGRFGDACQEFLAVRHHRHPVDCPELEAALMVLRAVEEATLAWIHAQREAGRSIEDVHAEVKAGESAVRAMERETSHEVAALLHRAKAAEAEAERRGCPPAEPFDAALYAEAEALGYDVAENHDDVFRLGEAVRVRADCLQPGRRLVALLGRNHGR